MHFKKCFYQDVSTAQESEMANSDESFGQYNLSRSAGFKLRFWPSR